MSIDFNQQEYIDRINVQKRLDELKKASAEIERKLYNLEGDSNSVKNLIKQKQQELEQYDFFSRIKKSTRNKIRTVNNDIQKLENEIKQLEKEMEDLQKQRNETLKEIEKLEKETPVSKTMKTDGATITITDDEVVRPNKNASNEILMVHCTDFFPRNRKILCAYDGRKTGEIKITYKGVTKTCKSLSHRHSCHFTLNNVVRSTGDGAGSWNQPKFIVIDPLKNNEDKFVNLGPSDSWTYGSVTLSEKPILLVRDDVFDEIPKEEFNNYNIIKYKGDYKICVQNAIRLLGYKIKETDPNSPGHSISIEMATEINLNNRNLCLNYIFDNSYNGVDSIFLNDEQMAYFYGVSSTRNYRDLIYKTEFYTALSESSGVPKEFVRFVINNGIKKENNMYTFKNDEELYLEAIKIINSLNGKGIAEEFLPFISENIDINGIQEMYKAYINNAKDGVTEKQKILFEYGQEFGDFKGASTGKILSKKQNDLLDEYQSLIERQIDSLSDDELKIVLEVQKLKLSLLSKAAKEKNHSFSVSMKTEITPETSEMLKQIGQYSPVRKKGISLHFEAPDTIETMSKISGVDIRKIWEQQPISDEETYEKDKRSKEFSEYHSLFCDNRRTIETDCDLSDCKTVKELSERLMKYARLYERFYSGEKIYFDQKGNFINSHSMENNESSVEQENFEQAKREFEEEQKRRQMQELERQEDLPPQGKRQTM